MYLGVHRLPTPPAIKQDLSEEEKNQMEVVL